MSLTFDSALLSLECISWTQNSFFKCLISFLILYFGCFVFANIQMFQISDNMTGHTAFIFTKVKCFMVINGKNRNELLPHGCIYESLSSCTWTLFTFFSFYIWNDFQNFGCTAVAVTWIYKHCLHWVIIPLNERILYFPLIWMEMFI